jgi:uncharacterized protein with von Willebrand factor type A (vWA) domain
MTVVAEHLHGFLAALTAAGVASGTQKQVDFLRAVALAPPPSSRRLYWTARVTLVRRREEIEIFDRLFEAWFGDGAVALVPPAQNWNGVLAALADVDYPGQIVIESFSPEIREIARAVSLWRPLAESPDALVRDGLASLRRGLARAQNR